MTFFDVLREQVRAQPDAIAASTPYRVASYRKMWSRIERSTARLQGEWAIAPGDVIAYFGRGHLDALVMYFAAARCGAVLLPLEHAALQRDATDLIAAAGATLVLHDDALVLDEAAFGLVKSRPLSTLIATVCSHRESVREDGGVVSLIQTWPAVPPPGGPGQASDHRRMEARETLARRESLDALATRAAADQTGQRVVAGALFDADVFAPIVLATMLTGQMLTFEPAALEAGH